MAADKARLGAAPAFLRLCGKGMVCHFRRTCYQNEQSTTALARPALAPQREFFRLQFSQESLLISLPLVVPEVHGP